MSNAGIGIRASFPYKERDGSIPPGAPPGTVNITDLVRGWGLSASGNGATGTLPYVENNNGEGYPGTWISAYLTVNGNPDYPACFTRGQHHDDLFTIRKSTDRYSASRIPLSNITDVVIYGTRESSAEYGYWAGLTYYTNTQYNITSQTAWSGTAITISIPEAAKSGYLIGVAVLARGGSEENPLCRMSFDFVGAVYE